MFSRAARLKSYESQGKCNHPGTLRQNTMPYCLVIFRLPILYAEGGGVLPRYFAPVDSVQAVPYDVGSRSLLFCSRALYCLGTHYSRKPYCLSVQCYCLNPRVPFCGCSSKNDDYLCSPPSKRKPTI